MIADSIAREHAGGIMVVDDQPANLKLLENMLGQQGYKVRSFPRGRLALSAAALNPPDLILLDINMPEMNGYEVCEQLKSNGLSEVPVIFLSALSETDDKLRAFHSGGLDYITKPFQLEEVQARVKTHLELYRLRKALRLHAVELEQVVSERTRELAEAHARLKIVDQTKSDFLNLISHEFRSPLNGLFGVGELLLDEMGPASDEWEARALFDESRRRILTLLDDASLLTRIDLDAERFASKPVPLASILHAAIDRAAEFAKSRRVTIDPAVDGAVIVAGDQDLLTKALHSLLETAVKFSTELERVALVCQSTPDFALVTIESSGYRIPEEARRKFFDLFSIGETLTPGGDIGLGPPVAHRILELFGATVTVENLDPAGIRLTVGFKKLDVPFSRAGEVEGLVPGGLGPAAKA